MITFTLYDGTGNKRAQIALDLSKSRTAEKIVAKLRAGEPGWTWKSMEALDSGRLTVSHAIKLWNADQIREAIERRMEQLGKEDAELKELKALLGDDGWRRANGGEAAGNREAGMAREWMTIVNAKKSVASGDLRKSSRVSSAVDTLTGFGWETPRFRKGATLGDPTFTNYRLPGHEITIDPETQRWTHHKGQREIAKSTKGASPVVAAADLMAHLTRLHDE